MRRHRPHVVVGLGGFVTGPGGVAAWLTRAPLVIHEQNAIAGFTNRRLAPLAREVLEAFPNSFDAGIEGARHRQSRCARKSSRCRRRATRFAQRSGADPHSRHRRQPRRDEAQCRRAVRARAPRRLDQRRSAPSGRRALGRVRAQELRGRERARGRAAVHRRHGRSLRVGGSRHLPRRRAHDLGARGRRCRRDPRAVPRRGGRSPDPQRAAIS